jgi:hypothetical protein
MGLSRHARNRLRWIRRRHGGVTEAALTQALLSGTTLGYDERGHRRVLTTVGSVELVVVVDDGADLIITLWVRWEA